MATRRGPEPAAIIDTDGSYTVGPSWLRRLSRLFGYDRHKQEYAKTRVAADPTAAEKRDMLRQSGLSDADISEIANQYTELHSPGRSVEISDEEYERLLTLRK